MAIQTEGRRLAIRENLRPQLDLWLVGWKSRTGVESARRCLWLRESRSPIA
jgi:hypothetical protein